MNMQKLVSDVFLQLLLFNYMCMCEYVCFKYPGDTASDLE